MLAHRIDEPTFPRAGDRLDEKYELEAVLGEGGAGVVFAARRLQLGDRVAIKVLRAEAARDPIAAKRLLVEARATSAIKSPHVVRVLDVDVSSDGWPYLVMELLEGVDLRALQQTEGALAVDDVVRFVLQTCSALAEAHAHGITHRDLKPANLFLTRSTDGAPIVKILDFGISKAHPGATFAFDESLTATTAILGSPAYMSPEQVRDAKSVDARTDIWALGVILYQLLANAAPFDGSTFSSLCAAIVADEPPPLRSRRADVPARLEAIVMRCLEKDPARRYSSVDELAAELRGARVASRGRVLLPVGLVVAVVAIGVGLWRGPRPTVTSLALEVTVASIAPTTEPAPKAQSVSAPPPVAVVSAPTTRPIAPKLVPAAKSAPPIVEPPAPEATIDPLAHAY